MRKPVHIIILGAALLAVAAFSVSLIAGLRGSDAAASAERAGVGGVPAMGERIEVEVLNGAGREGLARRVTGFLREHGFDVVYYGNAASFDHDSTLVIDRVGKPEQARAVARALGGTLVRSEPDSTLLLDATVVLGDDLRVPPSASPTRRGGWRAPLRHLFRELF